MIGEKIVKRRKELGITQEELVLKAEEYKKEESKKGLEVQIFNQAQLSRWENNQYKPNTSNMTLLSILLNCDIEYLMDTKISNNLCELFFKEGVRISEDKELNIKENAYKLLETIRKRNMSETISNFIELILKCRKSVSLEVSGIVPQVLSKSLSENSFYNYMMCFVAGLNGKEDKHIYYDEIFEEL